MSISRFFGKKKNLSGLDSAGAASTRGALGLKPYDVNKISQSWAGVEELVRLGKPSQLRQALIKADKLLDYALTQLSRGETMGERLKNARPLFDHQTYNRLWQAHKVRNALVHEAEYEPPYHVVKEAVGNFKKALAWLGVKDV